MARDALADEVIEAAASGDVPARRRVHAVLGDDPTMRRSADRLLRFDAAELAADLTTIIELWGDRVFPRWGPAAMPIVERDVAAKAALLASTSPAAVVAAATSGLDFEPPAWLREIVIAPSVALRPFVVPADFDATRMFLVSVSDEAIDPEGAVPRRLAKLAAAVGDPIRVRALRELARHDGLTTSALAERLGVERTSLHHHLGLLRSAGLLSIEDRGDGGWHYRVRRDRVEDLGALLQSYLEPDG
jgi:DNA-binding transcriptional ArsR family regulator